MAGRIVLFGATGYTGELTARALAGRGARPLLAGRNAERLQALAHELGGLETAVADVERPASIRALVERGDVLVSTVGPFARWGEPAIQAAIGAGAHYLDSTGEAAFIRTVFERHGPGAQAAGSALLTAFGYDFVPGNLAGALALREAGDSAARVDVGYFMTGADAGMGALSGGTRASAAGAFLAPAHAWRGGRLVLERGGARVRSFTAGGRERPALTVGGTEQLALPRLQPGLREVDVHLGWFGPATRALSLAGAATSALAKVPGAGAALGALTSRAVRGSSGGPDAATRSRTRSLVVAVASDAAGMPLSHVELSGSNAYDFTADMLAWGAERAAAGGLGGTGALGPVDGFGLDALEAGAAQAGLTRA
jgi:short subunit dehydrogenase-like uncharacterized protein